MGKPIGPDMVYHLKASGDPTLSPDGKKLIFVKGEINAETHEGKSALVLMDLDSQEQREFTQGPKDSFPRFSPNGKHVAFLRADDKGRRQIWLIPTSGGEARSLTKLPGGITELSWAEDSSKLAFVGEVDPDQLPDDHDPKKDPRTKVVTRLRYRFDTLGWVGNKHRHIFSVDIDSGDSKQLTDGDWDDSAPRWSPDGSKIAFMSSRTEKRELEFITEIYTMNADGSDVTLQSEGIHNSNVPSWSPDGSKIVFVGSEDPEMSSMWQGSLYVKEPGGTPKAITDDSVSPATGFGPVIPAPPMSWGEDGSIYFLADAKGESFICKAHQDGKEMEWVAGGSCQFVSIAFDQNQSKAIVAANSPSSLGELVAVDLNSRDHERLVHLNDEYLAEHPPAKIEKFSQERANMQIESRVFFPPDFDENKKYPMVLEVHGGPHGAFYDSFIPWHQVLATAGFIVLAVNPRGSSTYGSTFVKAVLSDWGGEDYLDIMNAVDELCSRPYVDQNKVGVHGYSYGGFMSSWIVGQTTRFKAAAVGAPCIDLPSFWGTSDIGIPFGEIQWGGTRFQAYEKFLKHSPLTYVENVETPVLLLHGEEDYRCPIEQSEQYFTALKRQGKEVEFVRFPGCSHLFLRFAHPKLRQEYLQRILDWFNKHLN